MSGRKRAWLTAFIPHRLELLLSPSWQLSPRSLKRVLERLEIEHLRHGGYKNGELYVSFNQFVECGISRRSISPVLKLGEELGLLETVRNSEMVQSDIRAPNAYRLTYVPAVDKKTPSDEWRRLSKESVESIVARFKSTETTAAKATRKEAA
jgi:hypothetical protein